MPDSSITKASLLKILKYGFVFTSMLLFAQPLLAQQKFIYRDQQQPQEKRISDLISRLTLEEKISLLGFRSSAVPGLGIPAYNWWNEALHGVARAGKATVFPQAIGMAASFNDGLLKEVAAVISTEARAKYNLAIKNDNRSQYMGLTFWSPNINIFRDPRWGRGQETYGEDPFLTSKMGAMFVRGMQGDIVGHLKTSATAKHFAVHSGPEKGRHSFNAIVDEKDLRETYLYAFKRLVDAGVESVMCAYNRVNDQPCCTGNILLQNILRKEWNFKGHVVTDCGALYDIFQAHKTTLDPVVVAAEALKAGVNLDCSDLLQKDLLLAVDRNLVTEKEIDASLATILSTQFKLGFYDDPKSSPYKTYGADSVNNTAHQQLARKMAQQSMVLLKNDKNLLPLKAGKYKSLMVIGANAGSMDAMIGNYHGMSGNIVTFVEGITAAAGPGVAVQYDQGSDYADTTHFGGIWAAGESDLSIAVVGFTPVLEGEEGDAFLSPDGGDRASMDLPKAHIAFLKELRKKGKPVVVVVTGGSAMNIAAIEPYADAIILAWYPGDQGGNALADLVFGKISPAGRLPITFYKSLSDLPAYENYATAGRTYRYFKGTPLYPFGFGLSYTTFQYAWLSQPTKAIKSVNENLDFSVAISNTGTMNGDEVLQVYIQYPNMERMPLKELKAFKRETIVKGKTNKVNFRIPVSELQKWDLETSKWQLYKGKYTVIVGDNSMNGKLSATFEVL